MICTQLFDFWNVVGVEVDCRRVANKMSLPILLGDLVFRERRGIRDHFIDIPNDIRSLYVLFKLKIRML